MPRKRFPVFVLALLFAATAVAWADPTDDFIKAEMKRQNIPGLSLAIVRDGQTIKAAGYGVADIARKIPATPDTVYKIASVSKQFIATGIMLLVQEGRSVSTIGSASISKARRPRGTALRSAIF